MHTVEADSFIAKPNDLILITGATGFIGRSVVRAVLDLGFKNIRCLARPSSRLAGLNEVLEAHPNDARVEVVSGNLLSTDDCAAVAEGAVVILHLAAGKGEKAFPDAFMNSVVTTRNLLDACLGQGSLRRFVNISSFAVYANHGNPGAACWRNRARWRIVPKCEAHTASLRRNRTSSSWNTESGTRSPMS